MSKNRFKTWSQITDMVSGLAVLITLVILVIEVRENTAVTRMSAYQEELDRANEWRSNIASDPDQRYAYQQWSTGNGDELNPDQRFLLRMVLTSLFSQRESAYYAMLNGFLGDSEWERMFVPACGAFLRARGDNNMWGELSRFLTDDFVNILETEC